MVTERGGVAPVGVTRQGRGHEGRDRGRAGGGDPEIGGEGGFRGVADFFERAAAEVLNGFDVEPGAASALPEPERLEAVRRARAAITGGGFEERKPGSAGSLLERGACGAATR